MGFFVYTFYIASDNRFRFLMTIRMISLLLLSFINAQVAIPTFQGVQKLHSISSSSSLYEFTSHTFTNCGATGTTGPTLANCKSSYDVSWEDDTDLFNVQTQGIQEWTVPQTGTYTIEVWGAEGGNHTYNNSATPGKGTRMKGTFSLSSGQKLMVLVGQEGLTARYVGGGGGGTFVWVDGETSAPLIVAGGGGGVGVYSPQNDGIDVTTSNAGTNGNSQSSGGGANGGGGTDVSGTNKEASGGAGWLSNGNDGSDHNCTFDSMGGIKPLSGGTGGTGGGSTPHNADGGFGGGGGANARCGAVGGGGGGGYSGGGGGAEPPSFSGGGGGGSYNAGADQSNSAGVQENHGKVIITLL